MEGAVTLAVIAQLPFKAMDPPVSSITLPPEVPVIAPPH